MAIEVIDIVMLLFPLLIILIACELFTNGIEWLGLKLGLAETATGSVLAAVGTALPETVVPIMAIIFSSTASAGGEIAEGAILGAPFMLATLAMLVGGIAVYIGFKKGRRSMNLSVSKEHLSFDIKSFMIAYMLAFGAALLLQGPGEFNQIIRYIIVIVLILLYVVYVAKMLRSESKGCDEPEGLYFTRPFSRAGGKQPSLATVALQVITSLALIIVGAKIFVGGIESVAADIGIPNIILAFLIAPIATELPEKFNSVLWYWRSKDTLALGNITGAMVFQASIPVSIGIAFTEWNLAPINIASMIFAMAAISLIFLEMRIYKTISYKALLLSGTFYIVYVALVVLFPTLAA
jgi:cation:H+ antiporter